MAYLNRYVDSRYGLDTNDGSLAAPWKTLNKAATTAPTGNDRWDIYVANRGWDYPYRATTSAATAVLAPTYAGDAIYGYHKWHFQGAIVSANVDLTGLEWTRVPGYSNVYRAACAYDPYQLIVRGPNHWFVPYIVPILCLRGKRVPTDTEVFTWWYDTTSHYIYYCDIYGNPGTQTGVAFEHSATSGFSTLPAAQCIYIGTGTKNYHNFYGGNFFGGTTINIATWNSNIGVYQSRLACAGVTGLMRLGGTGNIAAYNQFLTLNDASYRGQMVLAGAAQGAGIYNNIFYGDSYAFYFEANSGSTTANIVKNNVFADIQIVINKAGAYGLTEDYNAFGFTGMMVNGASILSDTNYVVLGDSRSTGAHSIPPNVTQTQAYLPFADVVNGDFQMATGYLADKGTSVGLTVDFAGNAIVGTADIGAYEYGGTDVMTVFPDADPNAGDLTAKAYYQGTEIATEGNYINGTGIASPVISVVGSIVQATDVNCGTISGPIDQWKFFDYNGLEMVRWDLWPIVSNSPAAAYTFEWPTAGVDLGYIPPAPDIEEPPEVPDPPLTATVHFRRVSQVPGAMSAMLLDVDYVYSNADTFADLLEHEVSGGGAVSFVDGDHVVTIDPKAVDSGTTPFKAVACVANDKIYIVWELSAAITGAKTLRFAQITTTK